MNPHSGWRRTAALVLSAVLAAGLAGCAESADPAESEPRAVTGEVSLGSDGVQSITLVSGDDYRFVPDAFTVTPGQVRVTLNNEATQLTHSFEYPSGRSPQDIEESIPVVAPAESDTIEFSVSTPGEYAFICSFHEPQGHAGVMTVAG